MEQDNEAALREKAEKIVEAKQGFRANLVSYLIVNLFLFLIWLVIALTAHVWFPWFAFPLVFWGIGVAFHGWSVYGGNESRHDEMVQREMDRLKNGS